MEIKLKISYWTDMENPLTNQSMCEMLTHELVSTVDCIVKEFDVERVSSLFITRGNGQVQDFSGSAEEVNIKFIAIIPCSSHGKSVLQEDLSVAAIQKRCESLFFKYCNKTVPIDDPELGLRIDCEIAESNILH